MLPRRRPGPRKPLQSTSDEETECVRPAITVATALVIILPDEPIDRRQAAKLWTGTLSPRKKSRFRYLDHGAGPRHVIRMLTGVTMNLGNAHRRQATVLIATLIFSPTASAQLIEVQQARLCSFSIDGVAMTSATVIGTRADLGCCGRLLQGRIRDAFHSATCIAEPSRRSYPQREGSGDCRPPDRPSSSEPAARSEDASASTLRFPRPTPA